MHDEAVVGVHEAQLRRVGADRVADDPRDELVLGGDVVRATARVPAASSASGSRCVCDGGDLGHRGDDRALDLLRDLVRLVEREVARELEVQRELGARRRSRRR